VQVSCSVSAYVVGDLAILSLCMLAILPFTFARADQPANVSLLANLVSIASQEIEERVCHRSPASRAAITDRD
jgi:hypothetical protein